MGSVISRNNMFDKLNMVGITTLVQKLLKYTKKEHDLPMSLVQHVHKLPYKLKKRLEAYARNPQKYAKSTTELLQEVQLQNMINTIQTGGVGEGAFAIVATVKEFTDDYLLNLKPKLHAKVFIAPIKINYNSLKKLSYIYSNEIKFGKLSYNIDVSQQSRFLKTRDKSQDEDEVSKNEFVFRYMKQKRQGGNNTSEILIALFIACNNDPSTFDKHFIFCSNLNQPFTKFTSTYNYILESAELEYKIFLQDDQRFLTRTIDVQIMKKMDGDMYTFLTDIDIFGGMQKLQYILACGRKILETLNLLHPKNIYHHDIKPDNILYKGSFDWFLSDFDGILLETDTEENKKYDKAKFDYSPLFQSPAMFYADPQTSMEFWFKPSKDKVSNDMLLNDTDNIRDVINRVHAKNVDMFITSGGKYSATDVRNVYAVNDKYSLGITILEMLMLSITYTNLQQLSQSPEARNQVYTEINNFLNKTILGYETINIDYVNDARDYGAFIVHKADSEVFYIDFMGYIVTLIKDEKAQAHKQAHNHLSYIKDFFKDRFKRTL